ncbi:hypothetical protein RISK_000486 [Rhodopirellula islandica]|uniref:Uncharacterized protein n=1 Tax=Rhodopirellula islandica TaxID=595434 RepID=A0A0J1BLS9_RHOIS|nr:hypothetical protein RISK_000486 [Rhodopirellula islandica]
MQVKERDQNCRTRALHLRSVGSLQSVRNASTDKQFVIRHAK